MIIHCTQGTKSWWCTCRRQFHRWIIVCEQSCMCLCVLACSGGIGACACQHMYPQGVVHLCKVGVCDYINQPHGHLNRCVRQTQLTHVVTNDRWNMITLDNFPSVKHRSNSNSRPRTNTCPTRCKVTNLFWYRIHCTLNTYSALN